ncbi:hypothetical protein JW872_01505 [Candidatus Babeliales bacterium]|nr:hypothetical protein [Candidatus Babeliales bacterium]
MNYKRFGLALIISLISLTPFFIYRKTITETTANNCTRDTIGSTLKQNQEDIDTIIQKEVLFNLVLVGLRHEQEGRGNG